MKKINFKFISTFFLGFTCCLIFVFFLKPDANIFALNNNTKTALEVTYPIEINGEKIDIKAYNIDGRTYMSLKDISDNTHLITTWIPDEQKVVIRDGSHIVIKEINGKKYVDMSYWFSRYNPNQEINGKGAMDVLPYTLDHNSIMHGYNLVSGMPMENLGSFGWYIEQEYFFEYIYPLLPNIVKENEAAYDSIE